ncbi:MAG: HAD family hydrolase [Conexivisphaerales archaeon]
MGNKAVFLDRDGTIVSLVYDKETGYIDSITRPEQVKILPGVTDALKQLKSAGYKLIIVSNQPAVAKGRVDEDTFWKTQRAIDEEIKSSAGVTFDGEYFCLHHPQAVLEKYRKECDCRKPKPGLILKAAKENDVDIHESYMIGDDILDIKAGRAAGCRTLLISHVTSLLIQILEEQQIKPDGIFRDLSEASKRIISEADHT